MNGARNRNGNGGYYFNQYYFQRFLRERQREWMRLLMRDSHSLSLIVWLWFCHSSLLFFLWFLLSYNFHFYFYFYFFLKSRIICTILSIRLLPTCNGNSLVQDQILCLFVISSLYHPLLDRILHFLFKKIKKKFFYLCHRFF